VSKDCIEHDNKKGEGGGKRGRKKQIKYKEARILKEKLSVKWSSLTKKAQHLGKDKGEGEEGSGHLSLRKGRSLGESAIYQGGDDGQRRTEPKKRRRGEESVLHIEGRSVTGGQWSAGGKSA